MIRITIDPITTRNDQVEAFAMIICRLSSPFLASETNMHAMETKHARRKMANRIRRIWVEAFMMSVSFH